MQWLVDAAAKHPEGVHFQREGVIDENNGLSNTLVEQTRRPKGELMQGEEAARRVVLLPSLGWRKDAIVGTASVRAPERYQVA